MDEYMVTLGYEDGTYSRLSRVTEGGVRLYLQELFDGKEPITTIVIRPQAQVKLAKKVRHV